MENKEKILINSLLLFSKKGYDAVGVQEIAEKSGITKPTLYHYFGSKKGLLDILLNNYYTELLEVLEEACIYNNDIKNTLKKIIKVFFYFAEKNPVFYRMQLSMIFSSINSEPRKAVTSYNEKIFNYVETVFLKAADNHGNMKGRHKAYAATFIGMINTYIGIYLNGHIKKMDNDLIYKSLHQFMHGIFS